jgi:hypothetical protein
MPKNPKQCRALIVMLCATMNKAAVSGQWTKVRQCLHQRALIMDYAHRQGWVYIAEGVAS